MATQVYGEDALAELKDVHWRTLVKLDELSMRERKARESELGVATSPTDAADQAARSWARTWRPYVGQLQGAERSWDAPSVEGETGFAAVVCSFESRTGIGVDVIHPSAWSRVSENRKTAVVDMLHTVERTRSWPTQVQTLH